MFPSVVAPRDLRGLCSSLLAFNAAFREFTGQTPSDYRRSMRADA